MRKQWSVSGTGSNKKITQRKAIKHHITQLKKFKIMATKNAIVSTAKKSAKIVTMTTVTMAVVAAQTAIADLKDEYKSDYIRMVKDGKLINYTWDPFDGMLA